MPSSQRTKLPRPAPNSTPIRLSVRTPLPSLPLLSLLVESARVAYSSLSTLTHVVVISFLPLGAENPTYLKHGNSDRAAVVVGLGGLAIGFVCILRGLYNMSWGINKI